MYNNRKFLYIQILKRVRSKSYDVRVLIISKRSLPLNCIQKKGRESWAGILNNLWELEPSRNRVVVPDRQATQPGGIGALESILRLLKSLKISGLFSTRGHEKMAQLPE